MIMNNNVNEELVARLKDIIESEMRSCSMDFAGLTPEYVQRLLGGGVPVKEIEAALPVAKEQWKESYR